MAQKKKAVEKPETDQSADFDFATFRQQVIAGLIRGEGLTGENGLLKPLIANFVQGALASELEDHLAQEKEAGVSNRRNGKQSKEIRSQAGEVRIEYDRDRAGTFEPVTVKKRQYELGLGFDEQILELYALSNSVADIRMHLERMYGAEMSESRISAVINKTWEQVEAWHKRPLASCYVVMFVDAVHVNMRREGQVVKIALYVVYGITCEGNREIIALYPGQGAESATEWGRCLQDLKNRGLEDVFILCSDGLSGFKEVALEVYPKANLQRCIVHKIRNCFRLIDDKDSKLVLRQLKEVYTALNEAAARRALEDFATYWQGKYDVIVQLWEKDWTELMGCMNLSTTLRKIVYTTNAIENLNREIRRVIKTKGAWVSDRALLIQLFLSLDRKKSSWNKVVQGWASIERELIRTYGERFNQHIK